MVSDEVAGFYKDMPGDQPKIAAALHGLLMKVEPDFEVRRAWAGVGYKQGSNYSCVIHSQKDHLQMMIMRGLMLEDKKGLLKGAGVNTRHLKFYKLQEVDEDYLRDLFGQQFKLFASGVRWE